MKEIVVISGKGGTGKTSITASLAYLAGNKCIVADCDVDAADLYLLLKPSISIAEDFYSGQLAFIEKEKCISCGKCEEVCRFDAISQKTDYFKVDPISCEGCGYCSKVCPTDAITNKSRKVGQMFVSDIKTNTKMVHAKLAIGADNSGKLVANVKNKAKELAKSLEKKYIIVDGSPGVGCPVISSLSGASLVVFVTEPTKSAFHDLKRVVQLVKKFHLPAVCIINKQDMNREISEDIVKYLEKQKIDLIASIPYSSSVPKAISQGNILTETDDYISKEISRAWGSIKFKLEKLK